MPGPVDMPLVISQMAHVQKITNAELIKSSLQNALVINPSEQELNKLAREQVQKVEEDEGADSVSKDGGGNARQQTSARKRKKKEEQELEEEKTASNASPWSGNIINLKI